MCSKRLGAPLTQAFAALTDIFVFLGIIPLIRAGKIIRMEYNITDKLPFIFFKENSVCPST